MLKMQVGFAVQVTTRRRIVAQGQPGQLINRSYVLCAVSIVKAFEKIIQDCPGEEAIVSVSLQEMPVFIEQGPWEEEGHA